MAASGIPRPLSKKDLDQQTEKLVEFLVDKFQGVNDRFDGVDDRFDRVNDRLDNVEGRLEDVVGRLGIVETKLDHALYYESVHVDARLKRLEKHAGFKTLAPVLKPPPPRK